LECSMQSEIGRGAKLHKALPDRQNGAMNDI